MRRIVSIVATAALMAACSGSGAATPARPDPPASRCAAAPAALVAAISTGLDIVGGGSLRNVYAVKSADFEKVWFVSGDLEGSGLEGADDVATWVTNDLSGGGGLIYAVGGMATQFSDWGDGGQTDAAFSLSDDGAQASADCVG